MNQKYSAIIASTLKEFIEEDECYRRLRTMSGEILNSVIIIFASIKKKNKSMF